jgi:molecular chaperone Hsp33
MSAMIGFNPDPDNPVHLCQGWMIQALPNTDLERFDRIRKQMDRAGFRELLGHESESEGYFEQIAKTLIGDEPGFEGIQMEACPVPKFECTCSREKMGAVLRSIPIPDRMTIVKRNEPIGINCQFCNERYEMTIEECIAAWNKKPE